MTPERERFLRRRAGKLGGSDIACLFGCVFKTGNELWHQKRRELETGIAEDTPPTWPMLRGTALEEAIITQSLGLEVSRGIEYGPVPGHEWAIFTADAIATYHGRETLFDAKSVAHFARSQWDDGVPLRYVLQLQMGLWITGLQHSAIIAAIGDSEPEVFEIQRDEPRIAEIIAKGDRFALSLLTGEEWVDEVDASVQVAKTARDDDLEADSNLRVAVAEFKAAKAAVDKATDWLEQAKLALITATPATARRILVDGQPLVRFDQREVRGTDFDRLSAEHPGLLDRYRKPSTWTTYPVVVTSKKKD